MALFYHPISVSAAVLSTLAVIASPALAQQPPAQGPFLGDRCKGYNSVEGTCLPPIPCPTIQHELHSLPLPEIIKRHGPPCGYDLEGNKLLCCPKNSTEPDLCQGYNGVEGTCQSYLSCSSLQQDAETLTLNTFFERHAIGCNSRASDGLICCPKAACRSDQWECGDGSCVPDARICDGRQDCSDNSDESNCSADCAANEFTCRDRSCIPNSERCNGLVDCHDGSDEEGCPQQDCEYDGSVHKHGEDDGCFYKCYNGTMKMMIFNPPTGNPCEGPFEIFGDNCYYFNYTKVTWCEARKACVDIRGELATDNFNTLKDFFNANKQGGSVAWVGVRDNLWLNGQQPQQQQWRSGQPDAQDQCGWIGFFGLYDEPCDFTGPFICQLY